MTAKFADLGLPEQLVHMLDRLGFAEPFPIQSSAIPHALKGRDIKGKAPTGSGKTLAFGLPLLSTIEKAGPKQPRALVLAPTRELAEQISKDLIPLGKVVGRSVFAIYGGVGYGHQISALRRGVDVLVATPGRMEDLIERRIVDLAQVDVVVVDEADRLADMGFLPAVRRILDGVKPNRQTMLFSATLDGDVTVLSRRYQTDPVTLEAHAREGSSVAATHHFWRVERDDRVQHTSKLIQETGRSIVFTRTRRGAERLTRQLVQAGVAAVSIHGGRSQSQRNRALAAFAAGRADALVATDVAARGIHVEGVASVIHYDPAADHKDYLHRSGRTARAGASGTVVTLVMGEQERAVRAMQRGLDFKLQITRPGTVRSHEESGGVGSVRPPWKGDDPVGRPGPVSRSIFVGNLPWKSTERDLETLFAGHGTVDRATVIRDRASGRSRGFGFVEMPESQGAKAIEALRDERMGGRPLEIRFAR